MVTWLMSGCAEERHAKPLGHYEVRELIFDVLMQKAQLVPSVGKLLDVLCNHLEYAFKYQRRSTQT